MHDTFIVFKDGREACGPIWTWRPKDGYLSIVTSEDRFRGELRFVDMESCVTQDQRIRIDKIADRDELERARDNGWDGT